MRGVEPPIAVILGAGWSAAVGLPLAAKLFDPPVLVASKSSEARMRQTLKAYRHWMAGQVDSRPELFLAAVQGEGVDQIAEESGQLSFLSPPVPKLPWRWAVELVGLRLATTHLPPSQIPADVEVARATGENEFRLRYSHGFRLRHFSGLHERFWESIFRAGPITGVVTTNYDLTAEQSLGWWPIRQVPGFYYGGFGRPQIAYGGDVDLGSWRTGGRPMAFREKVRRIEITGRVPVFKLHGSLNWAPTESGALRCYEDARPVFRDGGTAAIVPPLPEKVPPPWLRPVWEGAYGALASAQTWIVVGYSLPTYDYAVRHLLTRAARQGALTRIRLMDPAADGIRERWQSVSPDSKIVAHPGLGVETTAERAEAAFHHLKRLPGRGGLLVRRRWGRYLWWTTAERRRLHRMYKELRKEDPLGGMPRDR